MSKRITKPNQEERKFNIEISQGELVALVKYNIAKANHVSKKFGASSMLLHESEARRMLKVAKEMHEGYTARAKGLTTLLKS